MASYVESTLIKDEKVIYTGNISLWSLLPLILLGFVLLFAWGLGLIFWLIAFIRYKTTELAFTNKRVIAKFGFISRKTIELNLTKVESLQVNQGILGRIFNFGTLVISGAGNPQAPIPGISNPMTFRRSFMEYQDQARQGEPFSRADSQRRGAFSLAVEEPKVLTMASLPEVRPTSPTDVVISSPFNIAFDHVSGAIGRLGSVKRQDRNQQFIEGRIKYGLQSVKVRASLVERAQGETTVVIQASSDDVWGAGAKDATKRLVETLANLDNPGYKADRLGMHPAALVGVLIGFVFLLLLIMKYVVH